MLSSDACRNVFHSIDFLLKYSAVVREKVASGEVDIQGGVYDLETGLVARLRAWFSYVFL